MKRKNATRSALFTSIISLLLCVSMLVGTTFAWFTDSVTSANNIIKSGNLDVEMYWADGTKAVPAKGSTDWADASIGAIFNCDLWEPGYTEVRHIKIANEGSLALKYQLMILANGEVSKLADVIDVYFVDPAHQIADRTALAGLQPEGTLTEVLATMPTSTSGTLVAGDEVTVTLALKMQESAGNEYQNLAIGTNFSVVLVATQLTYEEDSFNDQYDNDSEYPEVVTATKKENEATSVVAGKATVDIPAEAPAGNYSLAYSNEKITTTNGKTTLSMDISLMLDGEKVTADGTTIYTAKVYVGKNLEVTAVTHKGEAVNNFNYDSTSGTVTFQTADFSPFAVEYRWDGTADITWYNDKDAEFVITTPAQLTGLAKLVDDGNTFAGKTVKLGNNIDLYGEDANGNRIFFEPIGDASNADFSGIFDGCGYTIFNLRQDCNSKHLGLFGAVYEGTVKNLVLDGALIENDGTGYAGGIASYAGAANFENITLRNTTVVNYNHNTGGIVAWCSNNGTTTTFDGINIEETTTIGSWWGSYDTRVGGVVGAMNTGNYVVIKNSKIACRLDVYNDVSSNYQWYNYRTAGMVVADVRDNETVDGTTQANPARVTCENVNVIFGDWANYHYCESASYGTPSYADEGEYKFRRVEAGLGYGGVDTSACNHAADETHNELISFTFLFGARDGKGIYGISEFEGVTVTYNNK